MNTLVDADEADILELLAVLEDIDLIATRVHGSACTIAVDDAVADVLKPAAGDELDVPLEFDAPTVVVADRLSEELRRQLWAAGAGWYDRSGHLRLRLAGVIVDRDVKAVPTVRPGVVDPLGRDVGRAVALELLASRQLQSVRQVAELSQVSVGAAHRVLSELRELGLVEGLRARVPSLFWQLAQRWRPSWIPLAGGPVSEVGDHAVRMLELNWDQEQLDGAGWALAGDRAAALHGAPLASGAAEQFFVPSRRALSWAVRTWGRDQTSRPDAALIALAPTANAVLHRRLMAGNPTPWPVVRPIVAALGLAADGSPRSREILDGWGLEQQLEQGFDDA